MSDYSPTSTPDLSTLAERERRDLRRRTGIGVLIAAAMVASLVGFVAIDPDRIGSVLLAGGILAGVGLFSWMRHCGSGHEHHRLRQQNKHLAAELVGVRRELAATRAEHQAALRAVANRFEGALRDLIQKLDEHERARRVSDALSTAAKINEHLGRDDAEHRPAMGQAVLRSVGGSTPALGLRSIRRPQHDEYGGEHQDG